MIAMPPSATAPPTSCARRGLLADQQHREADRERRLQLQHERREPGRHALVQPERHEAVVAGGHEQADDDHPAHADAGARHERDQQRDQQEPQAGEEEGREGLQADVEHDEVHAPRQRDEHGDGDMAAGHATDGDGLDRQERVDFLNGTRKIALMVDLRKLRTLRAVADHGTLAKAADALHLTSSAVSQQLAGLEREIGHAVLEPNGRTVRLTTAAHVLLGHADALFAQVERMEGELAGQDATPRGEIRVSGFPTSLAGLLAPAARTLRERAPELKLRVLEAETDESMVLLTAREVDVILSMECRAAPRPDDPRYHREDLLGDILDAVLPARPSPGGPGTRSTSRSSREAEWVAPPVGWSCDEVFMAGCQRAGYTPRIAHRSGDWQAVMGLVAADLGISLVPRLAHTVTPPGVTIIPLTGEPPKRHVFAACRGGAESNPAVRAVLDAVAPEVAA